MKQRSYIKTHVHEELLACWFYRIAFLSKIMQCTEDDDCKYGRKIKFFE